MKLYKNLALTLTAILLISDLAHAARILTDQVLFGVEYTFQDQAMVDEPGRNTISTPYKEQKASAIVYDLASRIGLGRDAVVSKTSWKPGHYINVPGEGKWVVNAEPVTIEINTTPRHLNEIEETARPIFEATKANGLVPYVNPAAERSGMGHIHVGAKVMSENPFFANPRLLRNAMVYLHKHPSLLYGFSEAYDNGLNSNIESYHVEERQKEFRAAVEEYDLWWDNTPESVRQKEGFNKFLKVLAKHDRVSNFFHHYRFMNLEHVKEANFRPEDTGKLTVEFRNFRPPKDPETAAAFAKLLVAVMEKQSEPEHKEEFRWITAEEYNRFNTGSKVADDWESTRAELGLKDKYLDAAVNEYVEAIHRGPVKLKEIPEAEIFNSYSQKERKGTFFELRLPVGKYRRQPTIELNGKLLEFEKVRVGNRQYWISSIDSVAHQIAPISLLNGNSGLKFAEPGGMCRLAF